MEAGSVAEIRGILIGALRKLRLWQEANEERPLDVLDDFLVRAESIRHIIRDAFDEELPLDPNDPKALVDQLHEWVPRLTTVQLGELLDKDPRTLQRWGEGRGRVTHRAQLVARLVVLLKEAWSDGGICVVLPRVVTLTVAGPSISLTIQHTNVVLCRSCGRGAPSMQRDLPTIRYEGQTFFRYSSYDSPFWARNNQSQGRWHVAGLHATQYMADPGQKSATDSPRRAPHRGRDCAGSDANLGSRTRPEQPRRLQHLRQG